MRIADERQQTLWEDPVESPEPARPRAGGTLAASALGTGSTGNAYLVACGSTRLLVDCGLGIRELTRRLGAFGLTPFDLDAIVLTHGHDDHVAGVVRASCGKVPVVATDETYAAAASKAPRLRREMPLPAHRRLEAGRPFSIGEIEVTPHAAPHDWRGTVALTFSDGGGGRIGLATDIGNPDEKLMGNLAGCGLLFLEFNHDLDMLRTGPYPEYLKARIAGRWGHLSNDDAEESLPRLVGPDTRRVVAVHLSRHNNRPEHVEEALERGAARLGGRLSTHVSLHDGPTPLFDATTGDERAPGIGAGAGTTDLPEVALETSR